MPQTDEERIRAFNRFYTEAIGALDERHEGLDLSLTQSRTLFHVRESPGCTISELAKLLNIDITATSRALTVLERRGLLRRKPSLLDGRTKVVELSAEGQRTLKKVETRSNSRAKDLVAHLNAADRRRLLGAMATVRDLLTNG